MSSKERSAITYHLVFYPIPDNADVVQFDDFLAHQTVERREADYVVFTSEENRIDIIRKCEKLLAKDFCYAVAFLRDGSFYLEAHPEDAERRLLALDARERGDMKASLIAISEVLAMKAEVRRRLNH